MTSKVASAIKKIAENLDKVYENKPQLGREGEAFYKEHSKGQPTAKPYVQLTKEQQEAYKAAGEKYYKNRKQPADTTLPRKPGSSTQDRTLPRPIPKNLSNPLA